MVAFAASGRAAGDTAWLDHRKAQRGARSVAVVACVLMSVALGGCYKRAVLQQSEGHIATPATAAVPENVPPPVRTSAFVPEPKPAPKVPTYTVVVNEVPVKELLQALARDTKQNIDIHPGLQGLVSLNAINETLPAILDRVSKQVNMRYRVEGNIILVAPDVPYMKTYKVNYVNMTRESTSTIGVSGQISGTAAAGGASGPTAGASGSTQANASNTVVKTVSNNNFWDSLRDNIRAILVSTRNQALTSEQRAERAESQRAAREERLQQAEAVARAGQAAPQLFQNVFGGQSQALPVAGDVRDDIVVNPVAGTISVFATEKQHALIQQLIDSVSSASQRQVLIEATIAEVTLSDAYQAGVDWSRLAISGGINLTQTLSTGIPSSPPFSPAGNSFSISYINPTSAIGNIASTIKLLNQFGRTKVLSSPKLMALNNQTALLKVVDNIVYFHIQAQPAILLSGTSGGSQTTFTTTAETVPVGVVMSVTPQINENGQITLTVRPTISRVLSFVNDPNPALANPCGIPVPITGCNIPAITSPVPQIQTREMESVLQLVSGQTAILGGLMQDNVQYNRQAVPGAGDPANTGFLSEIFGFRDDRITKSELIIFLRPIVVASPSVENGDLKYFQSFLPRQVETPTETIPGEKIRATP
jgi:general secretion pathway protein D